ncbi:MAG: hypothetical protein AAF967_11555 [Pseudomonadota bacterium]
MDIVDFQKRLTDFMISQVTAGQGSTDEAKALRQELDAAVSVFGDQIPDLRQLAEQLDLLEEVMSNPGLAASIAEAANREYEPNPEIFNAIESNEIDQIEKALTECDINQTYGELECTALYHAMSNMFGVSLAVVNLLLDKGADPSIGLGRSSNVLHGIGFGRFEANDVDGLAQVVARCVALGADIEQRSRKLQWTPLITAASEWNPVAVEALLLAGADIEARAGVVEGVCFSGALVREFAEDHEATRDVVKRYLIKN